MACNSLTSILRGCSNNLGGIKAVYIIPEESVTGYTESNGTVTAIGTSGGTNFSTYEFTKDGGSYLSELAVDETAGSSIWNQTVTLTIPRREVAKRNSIALLSEGQRNLKIIVKDSNGLYWYFGAENGVVLTTVAGGSGENRAAGSNYVLTFIGIEEVDAFEVDSTIIPALIS
jgi:hypothetical protein